jgi:hypothetical protein
MILRRFAPAISVLLFQHHQIAAGLVVDLDAQRTGHLHQRHDLLRLDLEGLG